MTSLAGFVALFILIGKLQFSLFPFTELSAGSLGLPPSEVMPWNFAVQGGEEDLFEPCTALEHRFQFPDAIDGLEYPSGFLLFFGQFEFPILHSHGPFLLPFSARRKVLQRLGLRSIRPPSFSFFGSPTLSGAPERLAACLLLLLPYSEGNSEANLQG